MKKMLVFGMLVMLVLSFVLAENVSTNQTDQNVSDTNDSVPPDTSPPDNEVDSIASVEASLDESVKKEKKEKKKDADYEILEFKGKDYKAYPILAQVNQKEEKIMNNRVNVKQLKGGKQLKVVNEKMMVFEKGDIDTFRVESTEDIYQIDDIRDSQEWGYLGTGTGTDTITASGDLIQQGEYICLKESKLDTFGYGDCIYYPSVYGTITLSDGSVTRRNQVSISIDGNVATVTYPLPYDPTLVNQTHPVIGYVTADGGSGTEVQEFKDIFTNNSIQNFSYISIRAQNSNLSNYEDLVDVFYIGDRFISSSNTYVWQLNQTQKGIVVAPSQIAVDQLQFCDGRDNFAGTDVNIINNSLPVYNSTNGITSTGSLVMYSSFKDFEGCGTPNIDLSYVAQRKGTNTRYSGLVIENGTTINGSYTTQSRMIFSLVADSQAANWENIAKDIAIHELVWVLNANGSSSSGGSNSSGNSSGGGNSSTPSSGSIVISPGSIDASSGYSTNSSDGITRSDLYLCKNSDCSSTCALEIKGGLIVACI